MNNGVIPLAEGFAPAEPATWRALVDKSLGDVAFDDRLVTRTPGGLAIQPLYAGPIQAEPLARLAHDPLRPWDVRTRIAHPDPIRARREILADLEGGAASVVVAIDPTAAAGVAVGSARGFAEVLDGVFLELAPVALDAGFLGPTAADWLAAAAKGSPGALLAFHLDPISALAVGGASPGPIESHLIRAATTAARLSEPFPKASLFLASGRAVHEAGGSEALELALAAAAAVAYAKALVRAGLTMDQAFQGQVLGLCADADYFVTIAKLRAARRIWDRIVGACGCDAPARIEACSSARMLTRPDAWTNMLRLTAAGFGAAVGGADSVILGAFTDALGLPTAFARRQSRNTQLVLMEEAHLGRVDDPAAGSGFIETLTDDLARAGWAAFQAIERRGGVLAALRDGSIARDIELTQAQRAAAVEAKLQPILGVTLYPDAQDQAPPVEAPNRAAFAVDAPDPRLPGPDTVIIPLTPQRLAASFEPVAP